MRGVKCADCDEYRNEWCEKVVDSPHPDMIRDCPYWHERKDLVEVIRCKDCKYYAESLLQPNRMSCHYAVGATVIRNLEDYCSRAERREE